MNSVIASLLKAIRQLADPAVVRVAAKSIAITVLIFVLAGFVLYYALVLGLARVGLDGGGLAGATAAVLIALVAFWFLFRVVALGVLQFFADEIVAAVEARHYPDAAKRATPLPFRRDLANSLRGIGRALLFNLIALPIAILLVFTAIGPAIVFLLVNAVLLGRELTDMAWLRHCGDPPGPTPVSGIQRFALGGAIAAMMLVPFAGLLAPIIGAAAGTHVTLGAMGRRAPEDPAHA
ncbi:EI24 domain-containing protein [Erythrobacter sp. JK5]|uniref:EI24 domain-containing protein n=1 Tax=Erythrobacter sp. JK5 TaxID=2829500 RepID=UPI002012DC3F|nr:EI24 domain-containing protein [Erythrobacter sp. JK5]